MQAENIFIADLNI